MGALRWAANSPLAHQLDPIWKSTLPSLRECKGWEIFLFYVVELKDPSSSYSAFSCVHVGII